MDGIKSKEDAITRDFFRGVPPLEPPAFTIEAINKRLNNPNFCRHCLKYKEHELCCRESPWHNKRLYINE